MRKYNNKSNITGNLIQERRLKKNMTRADLCKQLQLLGIDIERSHLYRIEHLQVIVKDFELVAFCVILDIDFQDVIEVLKAENEELKHLLE